MLSKYLFTINVKATAQRAYLKVIIPLKSTHPEEDLGHLLSTPSLTKYSCLTRLQSPQLQDGDNNSTYLLGF